MRLLTRSDFDGLACAAILKDQGIIDHWKFVHPKDLQDGIVEVTDNDVLANVPYVPGAAMWFDHHTSEEERVGWATGIPGESRKEDSAARVIYEYYGGCEKMPYFEEMVKAVDLVDAGKLSREDILKPEGWVLLGFIMDPRTGLGRFREFRIPNYQLMEELITYIVRHDIAEVLALPDVRERIDLYFEQDRLFREMVVAHTRTEDNVIVTDLRGVETIYAGNRFLIYSLYPEQNISVWIIDGRNKLNVPIAVGHSILNRSSKTNVGELMLAYGGGGHPQVGTCQVDYDDADGVIAAIVEKCRQDG
ncbi:MAG: exopolyphosphatase [Coriobacteriales bacterium]|jgi:nanoRNase/pAp phosphatase (c-di-AMP/oligoRNAs hydrolase)|nr:exopolyphosphatase [Coriobacteriales bacterium]